MRGLPYVGHVRAHRLKVTLADTQPPIWRRVLVDSSANLAELHSVLQVAFGWSGCHLHLFDIGGRLYGPIDDEADDDVVDQETVTLRQVASAGATFLYRYDFGDDWLHVIDVESIEDTYRRLPCCLDGRRSGPPEDCGDPHAYAQLVDALDDPLHPDRAEMLGKVDPGFDAEAFDVDDLTAALQEACC